MAGQRLSLLGFGTFPGWRLTARPMRPKSPTASVMVGAVLRKRSLDADKGQKSEGSVGGVEGMNGTRERGWKGVERGGRTDKLGDLSIKYACLMDLREGEFGGWGCGRGGLGQ